MENAKIECIKMECRVCGGSFKLLKEQRYTARGVLGLFYYDAVDCPFCGCQNIIQNRKASCEETEGDATNDQEGV